MGIRVLAISKGLGSAIPVYADSSAQVDFFIHGYTKLRFSRTGCLFYDNAISMIIVILAILVFALFANRAIRKADPNEVPGPFLNAVELIVEMLDKMVAGSMGSKIAMKFRNYVSALFIFILVCNLSGLWDLELQPQITESHFRWR